MKQYLLLIMMITAAVGIAACNALDNGKKGGSVEDSLMNPALTHTLAHQKMNTLDDWMDSIQRLSFVRNSQRYIDSFSNHTYGMTYLIDTVSKNEYTIHAGYNSELRFETYYLFNLNMATSQLSIFDPVSGDDMSIADYEKANQ